MARYLFVTICLLVGLASAGINDAAAGKRVALVIGNDDYGTLPDLRNAGNDARAVGRRLQQLGFNLVGGGVHQNLRRDEMLRRMHEFGDKIGHSDTVALFYFAGHGVGGIGGDNWLIPVDDSNIRVQEDVRYYSISVGDVLSQLEGRGKGVNILILDACRNNPLPSRARGRKSTRGLARMAAPSGSFITYAAAPGEVADDGAGSNGLFTQELLARLGEKPGQSIDDLMTEVANSVDDKSGGKQAPHRESSLRQKFYFTPSTGSPSPAPSPRPDPRSSNSKETIFWQSVQNSDDIADIQAYLDAYPNGDFAVLARNKIARLEKTTQRAEAERRRREEAPRCNELMGLERKDATEFWGTVALRDAELLVSDTRPSNWPVFTVKGWVGGGYSRLHIAAYGGNKDGETALDIAKRKGRTGVEALSRAKLRQAGRR